MSLAIAGALQGAEAASRTPLLVVGFYLLLLIGLGVFSSRLFRGTSTLFSSNSIIISHTQKID